MPSSAKAWAVIVAAGRAHRFGGGLPKQFAPVAGRPLALWSVDAFRAHPSIVGVTLVVPREYAVRPPDWMAALADEGIRLAAGGPERTDSVRLGLATVPADVELVAVHDGARPLVGVETIGRVLAGAGSGRGAIAARRVTDALKEADEGGRVVRTVDRGRLWRAETPQAFPRDVLVRVHRDAEADGVHAPDCAALCERYGVEVVLVEIAEPNPKVTRPEDVELVEALLRLREARVRRTGREVESRDRSE
jgi:2-C-methyl-D-erythritol 4-phosphate cytidylyltransferase